jgi:hypothetical protein
VFCGTGYWFYRRKADYRSRWDRSQSEARSGAVHISGVRTGKLAHPHASLRHGLLEGTGAEVSGNKLNANFTIHFERRVAESNRYPWQDLPIISRLQATGLSPSIRAHLWQCARLQG